MRARLCLPTVCGWNRAEASSACVPPSKRPKSRGDSRPMCLGQRFAIRRVSRSRSVSEGEGLANQDKTAARSREVPSLVLTRLTWREPPKRASLTHTNGREPPVRCAAPGLCETRQRTKQKKETQHPHCSPSRLQAFLMLKIFAPSTLTAWTVLLTRSFLPSSL